jgi:hypothetical protein
MRSRYGRIGVDDMRRFGALLREKIRTEQLKRGVLARLRLVHPMHQILPYIPTWC